ncbi:MAG: SDR family oxidoreductase [Armatimonadetes bacterium]|nr:SDR family oxidoreductase [Armatimonadota bacterium]
MDRLKGKTALITGAGSGIGRAGAMLFAREGAAVVVAEINPDSGERVAARIRDAGGRSLFVRTDVGDSESVRNTVAHAEETFGGVDILFTNAADVPLINLRDACATDLDEEVFDRIHRVILRGVFLCAKYAGQAMIRRGGGAMVFTGTVDAQIGCPGLDAYTAAKGGVLAMTRSLAAGLARYHIRVNAISPGFVATEPQAVFMDDPVSREQIQALHLLPVPPPEDVVPLALFLASDEARGITGSIHQVDAGYAAFKCAHIDVMESINRPSREREAHGRCESPPSS